MCGLPGKRLSCRSSIWSEAAAKFVEDGASPTATPVPVFEVEIVSGATIVKDLRYEVAKGIRMLKEGEDE